MPAKLLPEVVPPEYVAGAWALLVGEAPGRIEVQRLRPFVGPAGEILSTALKKLSLQRGRDVSITNVSLQRPENNKWLAVPKRERAQQEERLRKELLGARGYDVIVALGDTATRALCEMKSPSSDPLTFSKMRGLWWPARMNNPSTGRPFKVLVTHHPSNVLQCRASQREFEEDLAKILDHKGKPILEYDPLPRQIVANVREARELAGFLSTQKLLAYDVETIYKGRGRVLVDCISICWSPTMGAVFETFSRKLREQVVPVLRGILEDPSIEKIGQNVGYDRSGIEAAWGFSPKGTHYDTMDMHILLDPAAPAHSLAYLTSLYCNVPYLKTRARSGIPSSMAGAGGCYTV